MDDFDLDPDEIARLGRLAVDAVSAHRRGLTERPVFGKVGASAGLFQQPLPEEGRSADEVLAFVRDEVMTRPFGNSHPRFFGFINATADPLGSLADYLASTMNSNCWGGDHAAVHVEHQVIRWLAEALGLPPEAEGILTSGGSMANFVALGAARRAVCPAVRDDGPPSEGRLVVYASDQVHNCVDRAVDLLGLGMRQLRKIPSDDCFRLRLPALREAVAVDRRAGLRPAIVVGTAGTVNTGAIDPLEELLAFCRGEGLWFHVDGAYGALATLSTRLRPLFRGMEQADSVAADPHKWLYVPYEAGAVLLREPGRLAAAYRKPAEYLVQDAESPFLGAAAFNERGPELSRSFKALKVFVGFLRHGRRGYAAAIERDVALARFLMDEVGRRPDFEPLAEPILSIANFRYRPQGVTGTDDQIDRLNVGIVNRLVGAGSFFLAPTRLRERVSLRVAITNFRTTEDDLRALLDEAAAAGRDLLQAGVFNDRPKG
jgi:glutamate/tyrosine decarboxylase-like PLP-dependent enzyme